MADVLSTQCSTRRPINFPWHSDRQIYFEDEKYALGSWLSDLAAEWLMVTPCLQLDVPGGVSSFAWTLT